MENKILKFEGNDSLIIVNDKNIAVLKIQVIDNKLNVSEPKKIKYIENVELTKLKN